MQNISDADKQEIIDSQSNINLVDQDFMFDYQNTQTNQNQQYEQLRTEQMIQNQDKSLENLIQKHPSEYYFGLEFDVEEIKNNQVEVSNLKLQLMEKIRCSSIITQDDKKQWNDVLKSTNDINLIQRIAKDFDKATRHAKTDRLMKQLITQTCQTLNKNYFNGYTKIAGNSITLPPMYGSEKDFIEFYQSSVVQEYMNNDARGLKIQKLITNPFVDLCINLGMRAFRQSQEMKAQQKSLQSPEIQQQQEQFNF